MRQLLLRLVEKQSVSGKEETVKGDRRQRRKMCSFVMCRLRSVVLSMLIEKKDFLCSAEFSPFRELPEYVRALIHLVCLRVFSVTLWVIVYRLYRVR